jgi:DNA invertase Pin-like site-specific DNA recombinase
MTALAELAGRAGVNYGAEALCLKVDYTSGIRYVCPYEHREKQMSGRYVAYYRVSTLKQGASGLGLEAQRESVRQYLGGKSLVAELTEVESGKKSDRPKLAEALRLCRTRKATLIIAKLDRLSRNVNFISNLMESKVEFVAVDFPTANRLTVHILSAVAEHEALVCSQRTKAALQAAKARGVVLGGDRSGTIASQSPKGRAASVVVRAAKAMKHAADIIPTIRAAQAAGAGSMRLIADYLNLQGETAPRGGEWSAGQVYRVLLLA